MPLNTSVKKQASIRLNRKLYDFVYLMCQQETRTPSNYLNVILKKALSENTGWKSKDYFIARKLKEKQTYAVAFRAEAEDYELIEKRAKKKNTSTSAIFHYLISSQLEKLQNLNNDKLIKEI